MLKPRLEKFYDKVVCEDFILLYNLKNISQIPSFERAVLSSTSKNFLSSKFSLLQSFSAWSLGTSQKCVTTRAQKSIALFGIREKNILGLKVTLRKTFFYTMLDKLLIFVLPKVMLNSKVFGTALEDRESTKTLKAIQLGKEGGRFIPLQLSEASTSLENCVSSVFTFTEGAGATCTSTYSSSVLPLHVQSVALEKDAHVTPAPSVKVKPKVQAEPCTRKGISSDNIRVTDSSLFLFLKKSFEKKRKNKQNFFYEKNINKVPQRFSRAFFTINNKNSLFFPEISQLLNFFDVLPGFSIVCSLKVSHKSDYPKEKSLTKLLKNRKTRSLSNSSIACTKRNERKKIFLSAFQFPIYSTSKI